MDDVVYTDGCYSWIVNANDTATITRYMGSEEEITVPRELGGCTVTGIGNAAFSGNGRLRKVIISATVMYVGINPFEFCWELQAIEVAHGNNWLQVQDCALISVKDGRLVSYPADGPYHRYTVPNGVLTIGENAFNCARDLKTVFLPESVKFIGKGAFSMCFNMTGVEGLPDDVDYNSLFIICRQEQS